MFRGWFGNRLEGEKEKVFHVLLMALVKHLKEKKKYISVVIDR